MLTTLLLGFTMILMLPISDIILAKPNFGGSSLGKGCGYLWDQVKQLRDKRSSQGGILSDRDAGKLGNADSNYNSICKSIYGPLPLIKHNAPKVPINEGNAVVDNSQTQNGQESSTQGKWSSNGLG